MRQSQLFTKTRRDAPTDEVSKNAQLLIRAGFINKEMSGVYDYLPLGLIVLNKIVNIIRDEMNSLGGQEVSMSSLQRPELWSKTDRWENTNVDSWFKTKLKEGADLGLAFTHEEPITNMMEQFIPSYKDLPVYVYQFQTKFRNETRAKSGIMRAREFLMKDLYSFSRTEEEHDNFYEKVAKSYEKIFNKVGIGDKTFRTFASGGSFSKFSHEFQTVCEAGEDIIYIHRGKNIAINKEVYIDEVFNELGVKKDDLEEAKAIEVGNIFSLSTKFSKPLLCQFTNENGENVNPIMGSYGIGPGRLMGTIVELLSDDKGIVWPKEVSPFAVHLVRLGENEATVKFTDELYLDLQKKGVEVLYDDRDLRPGEKFADSDLIGIPIRFVVSDKTVAEGKVEIKKRTESESNLVSKEEALKNL